MYKSTTINQFAKQPVDSLKECDNGPLEISGGDKPYVVMTADYLKRLLVDSTLANQLDDILSRIKKSGGVSEEKVMELLGNK